MGQIQPSWYRGTQNTPMLCLALEIVFQGKFSPLEKHYNVLDLDKQQYIEASMQIH